MFFLQPVPFIARLRFGPDQRGMVKTGSIQAQLLPGPSCWFPCDGNFQAALAARGLTVAELPKEFLKELRWGAKRQDGRWGVDLVDTTSNKRFCWVQHFTSTPLLIMEFERTGLGEFPHPKSMFWKGCTMNQFGQFGLTLAYFFQN